MPKGLTVRSVEQAKPATARREIPDGLLPGLYLVVQPSGAKSWAVRYRHGGKPRKHTLGSYPALSLTAARDAAGAALRAVAKGDDPATLKRVARRDARAGGDLVETVVADFLNRHAKALRTYPEIKRMMEREVVPKWRGRRVQDITRRDVIDLLDGLVDRGIGRMTNMVFSVVRKFFRWCIERDVVTVSPCAGLRAPVPETSRERVLTDDEIRLFWKAAGTLGYPFGPLFRLLLVTGQRLGEVAGMTWAELDLSERLWSLPSERTKNGRAHDVPLSDLALSIIEGLPAAAKAFPLVFTTTGRLPVSGFSRAKRRLDAAIAEELVDKQQSDSFPNFTLHDLRRTLATGLQRLGVAPHVTEAVLNHRSGVIRGVAAIYGRHDFAREKRESLDSLGRWLADLTGPPAS